MKINIGYFADGPWSHYAFEKLVEDDGITFSFICVRFDTIDSTLKEYCEKYKIDYLKDKNINSPSFLSKISEYKCDLFISLSFNQIFKKEIINIPTLKTINCHAGKLPFYRGRNVLNWVLINDENEFGITIHFIDEGIDSGNIVAQRKFPTSWEDTGKTIYEKSPQIGYLEGFGGVLYRRKFFDFDILNYYKEYHILLMNHWIGVRFNKSVSYNL